MNLSDLQAKIEKFSKLLGDFGATGASSKELWQFQKEILRDFKETIFENREDNQLHWEGFQHLVDKLRRKQDEVNSEYEKFANEADSIISQLEMSITNGFFNQQLEKADFAAKKEDFAKVFELFKENRWPSRERRTAAWDKYNGLRDMLRKEEDEFYIRLREKITQRSQNSQQLTEKIIVVIDTCHPVVAPDALADILKKWVLYLTAIDASTVAFAWVPEIKDEQLKTPLKLRSDALRDIRKFINDHRDHLTKEDKQNIYERLDVVQEELDKAWDERKKQHEEKQIAWEKNQREFLSKLEERLEKQVAFKNKLEKIYDNQLSFLEKQEARYASQHDFLNKLDDQLEDLEDKHATAWTDDFKNKVAAWIDEKNAKRSEVEDSIADIEDKIADVKKNIDELPDKIKDVEKSIEEIKIKMAEVKTKLAK